MKKIVLLLTVVAMFVVPFQAVALDKEDVKAFVEEAAVFAREVGQDKALEAFMDMDGKFVRGELYIFAYDFDGTNLALAPKPQLVGRNLIKLVDANGVKIIEELGKIAKNDGAGWLEYNWENPTTKKVEPKISYVVNIDNKYWMGSGIYK